MTNAQAEIRKNIIELFEIEKLPEEKQEETIGRIGKIIFQAVLTRVLPFLEEKDLEQYDKLMDSNPSPEQVLDFLFDKVPNFLQIVAEETENFRKEAGEVLGAIKNTL
ncbi:hypothetical protein A3G06_00390 [Candidatus Nomurabacteria bacterium RIFCSPLOWO2_12_FULL_46_14]|uniref:Uncharacterized protein n=1 Tax=Candidatus Nomurabacteria bacterium RIFCSPLOWO2_12_FULL_46_14 TaxID=1801797 RepID=A0A1F6Y908_9BACT|nr:MAG: hypothetical protein A3G06_00390 [Candidatus Nomurabacteria bacterium RIFCSPLOWO2_12_FULL_46_14]